MTADPQVDQDLWRDCTGWPLEFSLRLTEIGNSRGPGVEQAHWVCAKDQQSVFCLSPNTEHDGYQTTCIDLIAAVMRHVRESHCDGGGVLLSN